MQKLGVMRNVKSDVRYIRPANPAQKKRVPPSGLWPLILALLYGASPIDLIADIIPILGLTDDAAVILLGFFLAGKWTYLRMKAKREQRKAEKQLIP